MRALILVAPLLLTACASDRLARGDHALIKDRTFVVTGASSGFGRGVAEKLGRHGGNVVLAARREAALREVARAVEANGGRALVAPTDVSDPEQMRRLADAAVARFGRIDAWINNAGIGAIGRFEDIPMNDHARVVDVNLKGVIYGSHLALTQFRRQGFGTLVNVGSVESAIPLAYHNSYAATKHAVLGLTDAIHQELRLAGVGKRIRVSTVMPWAADTPWFNVAANYSGGTPRMVLLDPPEKVVAAIVKAAVRPRKHVAVGFKAKAALTADRVAPGLTEHVAANIAHDAQIRDAPPAPPTAGAIFQPLPDVPATVEGGVRARMEREDDAREQAERARAPK